MELYTSKETMQRLGIHSSTLRQLVKKGKLRRVVREGESIGHYPKEDVEQLARAREEFDAKYIIVA